MTFILQIGVIFFSPAGIRLLISLFEFYKNRAKQQS